MFAGKINIPPQVRFFFYAYLWGILFFTGIRIILLATNLMSGAVPFRDYVHLPLAFFNGFRFDTSISCYMLALPFILTSLGFSFRPFRNTAFSVSFYLLMTFYFIAFFISCADIPYFNHFGSRITTAALLWINSPGFMVKMILATFSFWVYLIPFTAICIWFYRIINRSRMQVAGTFTGGTTLFSFSSLLYLLMITPLLFLGIRGRIAEKSPMLTGTAYFCENNFINQLGLNPVFTFMTSVLEDMRPENQRLNLMDDETALSNVKKYLNSGKDSISPVARQIIPEGKERKMNVVFVIMEGMSRFNMGVYGGPENITPVLDSLRRISLWFEKTYTQGIHTYNGIYSSLYSYPALLKKHCMEDIPSKKYHSMPHVLKNNGYQTMFFITHDGQYDNAQGFLTANGFDRVYDESDYPSEKVLSTLGAPDDYVFEYSIPKMNEIAEQGKNFMCGFMTGSNHNPIIIPDWVKMKFNSTTDAYRIVEYADWSIGQFIKNASKQSWYNNTIFVFVSDHGANYQHTYDMPLAFHWTPLILFAPGLALEPKQYDCLAGQMDIFPTLMGLMNLPYVNNTMGIDLLKEKRPFIYFTADDKIGCLDRDFYFIHRVNSHETLYLYENLSTENLIEKHKAMADSMRTYAFSMLQATQWIVEREKFSEK